MQIAFCLDGAKGRLLLRVFASYTFIRADTCQVSPFSSGSTMEVMVYQYTWKEKPIISAQIHAKYQTFGHP